MAASTIIMLSERSAQLADTPSTPQVISFADADKNSSNTAEHTDVVTVL